VSAPRGAAAPAGTAAGGAYLIVRAHGERYGLPLLEVLEVVDLAPPQPVPTRCAALRGLMPLRERFVSLVHLGTLIAGRGASPPPALGDTAVVVSVAGVPMALEIEGVEAVVDKSATFVGPAPAAWASGVWRIASELVTVLDLGALAERITESGSGHDAG